ncbi:erythromycin esterase family protein [Streptomyces sp. NPDC058877]|uniref:erythromycin esterase family protein n=1 Tax=unclassified Streptomyces TaxID=2593676 RepID=UPI0036D0C2C6
MPDEVTRWLADAALPLAGVRAGGPTVDLQPLKEVLAGVRVVGLGEATHGTSEFFQLKHRLLEFLVTELGFNALAMEASASAGPAVDAYVRHGVGDAARAIAGLGFWTWRTLEVLAMVEWMRAHNRGRSEEQKVRFIGIDPQQCGNSLVLIDSFLQEAAPDRVVRLLRPLRVLATAHPGSRPDPERRLVCRARELLEFLRERFPDAAEALEHAGVLLRAADLVTRDRHQAAPEGTPFAVRDRYMADAVGTVLDEPSAKVVLWAHNGHVSTSLRGGAPALGRHLRVRCGATYYALGLLFGSGSFRARRMRSGPWRAPRGGPVVTHRIGPAPAGTVEARLGAARPDDHFVDLRGAAAAPTAVREWLVGSHGTRSFGAMAPRWSYRRQVRPLSPAAAFDGLAYVARSSPSLPFPA